MALASSINWEIRGGAGSDNNGGGFKEGASGTDFSQQNSAQFALTGCTTSGTSATFANANAASSMVGNVCQVISGTNFTVGFYEIISVSVGVSITVDRNISSGSGSNGVINIGGALNTIQKAVDNMVSGNYIHVKNATYAELVTLKTNGANGRGNRLIGYNSTRGDNPEGTNRPLIDAASSRARCIDWKSVTGWSVEYFRCTGATGDGVGSSDGVVGQTSGRMIGCKSYSNASAGFSADTYMKFVGCEAASNGANYGFGQGHYSRQYLFCYSRDNTGRGWEDDSIGNWGGLFAFCVADTNTGDGWFTDAHTTIFNCTSYNNGGDGYENGNGASSTTMGLIFNNISQGNAGNGFNRLSTGYGFPYYNFNQYNGNSSGLNNVTGGPNDVTSNASMTDPANMDFSLGGSSPCLNVALSAATFTDAVA